MDLLQLEHFKKIATLQHISRAAEELHKSQPSLSRTIGRLEDELGVKLFDRKGKNIMLNENGKALLEHANTILDEVSSIKTHLNEMSNIKKNSVSISVYAGSKHMPKFILGFKQQHPDIKLKIVQQQPDPKFEEPCDLSIFSSMHEVTGPNVMTLLAEDIILCLPKSNPLSRFSELALSQVADQEFICLQKGKSLREITDAYCQSAGFTPNVVIESDSPETVRELIREGIGISFIPTITWKGMNDNHLALIPISDPKCKRYIQLRWKEEGYISEVETILRNELYLHFSSLSDSI